MPILKIEMFITHKSAIPLLFIDFDFSPIYKADSGGSGTFSFMQLSLQTDASSNFLNDFNKIFTKVEKCCKNDLLCLFSMHR